MELTNKNRLIIIFGLTGILVLGYILYYFFLMPINVVKTSLPQNSTNVSRTPSITVFFDRKAASALKDAVITSEPQEGWSYDVLSDGSGITIKSEKELKAKTVYVLEISGRRIKPFKLTFTTKSVEFGVGAPNAWESFDAYEKATLRSLTNKTRALCYYRSLDGRVLIGDRC